MSERFCPRDGTALRSQSAGGDLVGTVIADRYHVIKKLGEGGMGSVYLAEHVKMGRKSAIKVMNPGMSKDHDEIERFNREASNASRMNHPNICAIYDFGETPDGLIYLAMEFIEGDSLTKLIEQSGALAPSRAASILHQAADALQVAHDYGIVHRDLKPDNIMIARGRDNSDLVKVVDFGIAKSHESAAQKVTKTGLVVGTPEYMSPEQLAGDKLDGRSDIYSLALVGFNMLTGTLPFPSQSAQEAMIMRLTDQPKTLAEMKPNVAWPDALQAVMDKALSRDVNARYAKAADFGREFSMAIDAMPKSAATEARTQVIGAQPSGGSAPTAALPQTRVDRASARSARTEAVPARPTPAHTPVAKKGAGLMIGVGVGVVGVVGVAVAYGLGLIGGSKDPAGANGLAQTPTNVATKTDSSGAKGAGGTDTNTPANPVPPKQQTNGRTGGGGTETRGGGGGTENPGGGNATPAAESVDDLIKRVARIATDTSVSNDAAERALQDIGKSIASASPSQRAELHMLQIGLFDHLKNIDAACRAAKNALGSPALGAQQRIAATGYAEENAAKSEFCQL